MGKTDCSHRRCVLLKRFMVMQKNVQYRILGGGPTLKDADTRARNLILNADKLHVLVQNSIAKVWWWWSEKYSIGANLSEKIPRCVISNRSCSPQIGNLRQWKRFLNLACVVRHWLGGVHAAYGVRDTLGVRVFTRIYLGPWNYKIISQRSRWRIIK